MTFSDAAAVAARRPTLIHHAAHRRHAYPASSLSAIRACLDAGARLVEVDITPMADGDFALTHYATLQENTTGTGAVAAARRADLAGVYYLQDGRPSAEPVRTLSEALDLLAGHPTQAELQLDLKIHSLLGPQHLALLTGRLPALPGRVRISTVADWALWTLARRLEGVLLGFDPFLYLDYLNLDPDAGAHPAPEFFPRTYGAFGYWDDHPLASRTWGRPAEYLALRFEQLVRQVPPGLVWYIRGTLLGKALRDGFDPIDALHAAGHLVDAWTLDADKPGHAALAARLAAAGVDRITTNDPEALADALPRGAAY